MRAVDYDRVSTDEQVKEGHSLGEQQERNISFIHSQSWTYVDSYIDDGYSAKDLNRPAIKRLMKDAEQKKFDVVVVYRLDRLVRSVTDLHTMLKHFDKHNILFKSTTEIYDTTTAMGRFFITLVAAIAQWERENLGERVIMGMEANFLKGGWNGGDPPYGYKLVDSQLDKEPSEKENTDFIFSELWTRGGTGIAKQLNREGKFMRNSVEWTDYAIGSMVYNLTYSGQRTWNGLTTEGPLPAYISPEDQQRLIAIRKKRFVGREKTATDYPFTGVTRCNRCGSPLSGFEKKNPKSIQRVYRCYGRTKLGKCDLPHLSEDTLETLLIKQLDLISDKKWIREIAVAKEKPTAEQRDVQKELEDIAKRKKKWQLAFANDAISLADLKARMAEESAKEVEIKTSIGGEAETPVEAAMSPGDIMRYAKELKKNWAYLEPTHKKLAVHALFKEIIVDAVGPAIGGPGRRTPCKIISVKTN